MVSFDPFARISADPVEIEKAARRSQPVLPNRIPRARLRHMPDYGISSSKFFQSDANHYQDRRSMTLLRWKRVEISVTGACVTDSTSSMKRIVGSVNWSMRRASKFLLST
jgi:hypothetical protein